MDLLRTGSSTAPSASRLSLQTIIEVFVTFLLILMPAAFGAVNAWSQQVFITVVAGLCVCVVVRHIVHPDHCYIKTWLAVPLGLGVCLIVFQLIHLPVDLVDQISPHAVALRKQHLLDGIRPFSKMCLSLYPYGTKQELRFFLALVGLFLVILNTYHTLRMIKRLLTTIALIGGVFAVLAILQVMTQTDKIYWVVEIPNRLADAGPFVNHSHFSQFMNLSIGAAFARLFIILHQHILSRKNVSVSEVLAFLNSSHSRILWLMVACIVLGMSAIFVSLSRGGMISLVIAMSFMTFVIMLQMDTALFGKLAVILGLAAFMCILYFGFEAVYDRVATLQDLEKAQSGRWQIIQDIGVVWQKFPYVGTGLGTHAVVYPMFDQALIRSLAMYAENEYAQILEETGTVGLVLLIAFVFGVGFIYSKNLRRGKPIVRAISLGLGYGLLAVMIHSFSDFGQHILANAALTMTMCAIVIVASRLGKVSRLKGQYAICSPATCSSSRRVMTSLFLTGLLTLGGGWAIYGASKAWAAEIHWQHARRIETDLREQDWKGGDFAYLDLLSHATRAVEFEPDNIEYQFWLNVFRWRSISRETDPNTGNLLLYPETREFAEQIVEELKSAREHCPCYGQIVSFMGELEYIVLGDSNGISHILEAYELAPTDAGVCFMAATMHAELGQKEEAYEKLVRTIALDSSFFSDAAHICITQLHDTQLALDLAGDHRGRISHVANILSEYDDESDKVEAIRSMLKTMLIETVRNETDVPVHALASLAALQAREGDIESAISNYRKALILSYGQVNWRYNLAKLLEEKGLYGDAEHEARICLRIKPEFTQAKELIGNLSVRGSSQ